jgi:Glycosyltransferase
MSANTLLKKAIITLKYEGVGNLIRKTNRYVKNKLQKPVFSRRMYKDVLFINGCTLPHPTRYRVDHQIEQLHFSGYSCDSVFYEHLQLDMVKYYRCFVFFRCPHTPIIEEFIKKAKYFNKKVFFDIDDLVIDFDYVKDIKYLGTMSNHEYDLYIDGVLRTKKTLLLCDAAITTTERLAEELRKYVPNVFINRNVASEKMVELSHQVLENPVRKQEGSIYLGYFSGSITHNDDFEMIVPALKKVFDKYSNVYLKVVGILDIPESLKHYSDRIVAEPFTDWTNLPELIASVDINLAPLENTIFNEAKSENKWVEAGLVKVPTIASNIGAFKRMIEHNVTGILCDSVDDWTNSLEELITNESLRKSIGNEAYQKVIEDCITVNTAYSLYKIIESQLSENIAFVLPSTQISGGVNVVINHCEILRNAGKDVLIISMGNNSDNVYSVEGGEINVVSHAECNFHAFFHKAVATLWSTLSFVESYPKIKDRYYLVQNYETDFYKYGHIFRVWANLTYNAFSNVKYITISKWCEDWLKHKFERPVKYARNGLHNTLFQYKERDFTGKIRVLIEGSSEDHYKNVDESFKIANKLDKSKFEIWYLSYNGKPKDWYRYDKFLYRVPYSEVSKVYSSCHILIKSSWLESFSYPPLEMMATGGIAVVAPNNGNIEYLVHEENCLMYEPGNIEDAVKQILRACSDSLLREKLIANGLRVAKERDWNNLRDEILALYDFA